MKIENRVKSVLCAALSMLEAPQNGHGAGKMVFLRIHQK
jgi:hypothetical protein